MKLYYAQISSPLCTLHAYADENALVGLFFSADTRYWLKRGYKKSDILNQPNAVLKKLKVQLGEYFRGERKKFDLPLKFEGTEFQKQAWKALARIPYGKTLSYGEQASSMGMKKAVRAVGSANGKNPISIVIPCHRVIRSDRSLGGYGGGLSLKEKLLSLEGVRLS